MTAIEILEAMKLQYETSLQEETDENEKLLDEQAINAFDYAIHACAVLRRIEYLIENSGNHLQSDAIRKKITTVSLKSLEVLIE